jgi:hypothetical protein
MLTRLAHCIPLFAAAVGVLTGCSANVKDEKTGQTGEDLGVCTGSQCGGGGVSLALPDLTVVESDHFSCDLLCTETKGFDVKNIGNAAASAFHVAVLRNANSYGFDIPRLAVGASEHFDLSPIPCGAKVLVVVNSTSSVNEPNFDNNTVTISGICF